MKRYRIDFSHDQFVDLLKTGVINASTDFEVLEVADPVKVAKVPPKAARKTRRTRAQIEADNAKLLTDAASKPKLAMPADQPDTTQRAFPWEDPEMNTDAA